MRGKHEEDLEEESQPVKADHAAKDSNRLARLTKEQADDNDEKTTRSEPACIATLVCFPERFNAEQDDGEDEDQNFREDGSEHHGSKHLCTSQETQDIFNTFFHHGHHHRLGTYR